MTHLSRVRPTLYLFPPLSPDVFFFLYFIDTLNSYSNNHNLNHNHNHHYYTTSPEHSTIAGFTYVKLMWRSFSKGSKEHVKEQAKEQLKLKIGPPQSELLPSRQSSIDPADCGESQLFPIPAPLDIQFPRSPYALQSPISPQNVNWDSNQCSQSEVLGSHPPTPGGDKELPQIPQASPAPHHRRRRQFALPCKARDILLFGGLIHTVF